MEYLIQDTLRIKDLIPGTDIEKSHIFLLKAFPGTLLEKQKDLITKITNCDKEVKPLFERYFKAKKFQFDETKSWIENI